MRRKKYVWLVLKVPLKSCLFVCVLNFTTYQKLRSFREATASHSKKWLSGASNQRLLVYKASDVFQKRCQYKHIYLAVDNLLVIKIIDESILTEKSSNILYCLEIQQVSATRSILICYGPPPTISYSQ